MKKSLILPVLGAVLVVGAGGLYAVSKYRHDPLRDGRAMLAKGDLRGASIELRTAVREAPGDREAHFALAQLQIRSNDPVAAEKELRTAADLGYDREKITPLLVETYLAQQKFKELLAEFPVPPGGPPEAVAQILVARGLATYATKDPVGAQAMIAQAERLAPNAPDPPFAAARIALATKDLDTAAREIDRTLTISPHLAPARFVKAQLLIAQGDRKGAIAQLDQALIDAPRYDNARLERANALILESADAKARSDVDTVLASIPNNAMAVYLDGVLRVRAKDFTGADLAFQKLSPVMAQFPRALFFVAMTKASLGQMAQATDAATRYVAQNPGDLDGLKLLGRIEIGAQRPDLAVDVLSKAADRGRSDADTLDLLGQAYTMTGKTAQALRSYAQAVELAPDSASILTRLAATRFDLGDASGAADDLQKSLTISPDQPNAGEALVVAQIAAGNLKDAATELDKLRAAQGMTESVGNLTGRLKVAELDVDGAREQFEKVAAAFPDAVSARLNLIKLSRLLGRTGEADAALDQLIADKPGNEPAVGTFVAAMIERNEIPRAIVALRKAHASAPDDVKFTAALAAIYVRGKEPQKALAVLDDAVKTQTNATILTTARASVQVSLGNTKDAIETYRKILALNPADIATRARLVRLLIETKDLDGARTVLIERLRVTPGDLPLMQALVEVDTRIGGVDAGAATAERLAQEPAALPFARLLKGDVYFQAKKFDEAVAAYAAALKQQPFGDLAIRYAIATHMAGKPEQAMDILRDWVAKHPDDADPLVALATLELGVGRIKDMAGHLESFLQKRPNNASALNNLAWAYQKLNDPRALDLAQRAYLISQTPDTADTYGWLLLSQGQVDKALLLLRQAAAVSPAKAAILYHYAVALKEKGLKEDAIRNLTLATSTSGTFDGRDAAMTLLAELSAAH